MNREVKSNIICIFPVLKGYLGQYGNSIFTAR